MGEPGPKSRKEAAAERNKNQAGPEIRRETDTEVRRPKGQGRGNGK